MLDHGFQPGAHVHFVADIFDMGPHRFRADTHLLTDFFVDETGREQLKHVLFARGKIFRFPG